ncbi:MAG: hypothetical protein JSR99_17860 [Proteobacteria bacterium]|nr:hypothetical protein [Pseudomonadota bacterium]
MQNIELFQLYSGKILGMLFARFPLYTEIKVENIIAGIERGGLSEKDAHEIAGYTIKWLQRAGYIDPATEDQVGPFRGTLSSKGFVCLTALPTGLEPKSKDTKNLPDKELETIGAQLAKSVEDGAKDYLKDSSKKVITWLVTKALAAGLLFIGPAN